MSRDEEKMRAAKRAVGFIEDGQIVGLGTGSTASHAITMIARRVQGGLWVRGVPTSNVTERLARDAGIELLSLNEVDHIDVTLDGADEIDPDFNMIKGGGGALAREKLVAVASKKRIIMVDSSKLMRKLGSHFPVPVEVLPFGSKVAARALESVGCSPKLREVNGSPFVTDNMNWILDCATGLMDDPAGLEMAIKQINGVVECGLFSKLADVLVVGGQDGATVIEAGSGNLDLFDWR